MAIGKRRDDIILKMETGADMRKAIKGYNVDFLNTMLAHVQRYYHNDIHHVLRVAGNN